MATLTMTPTRQPLGCIDTMRPLMSKLNRQSNAGPKSMKPNTIFVDSENIDPSKLSTKRKRTCDDEEPKVSKPKTSRVALSTVSPRLSTPLRTSQTISTPKSAPILKPAGRSPPPKSSKPGRRSAISKPRAEFSGKRAVARPFSLASALQTSSPKPAPKAPTSWFFDIHVDSEQDEMTNLMQHSTTVLDISDDEGKTAPSDGRGKENIPPAELGIELPSASVTVAPTATPAPRKESKMDEDRAPLGELNAADFYAEDCNAFSYVVVHEEQPIEFKKPSSPLSQSQEALSTSIASVLEAVTAKAADTETESQSANSPASDENTALSS